MLRGARQRPLRHVETVCVEVSFTPPFETHRLQELAPNRHSVFCECDSQVASHSGLMPANLTTLPHFSVSSAISFLNESGDIESTGLPICSSRALMLGSARPALISRLSCSMIPAGVIVGAPMPDQPPPTYPGTKSPTVGMSGSAGARIALVTASARSLPALMCSIEEGRLSNMTCTCPLMRSVTAAAEPR